MIRVLVLTAFCLLGAGCHNGDEPPHPWRCWGRNGEFFMPLESFVVASFVPLTPGSWSEAAALLGEAQAVPVSEAWVKTHAQSTLPPGNDPWYLVRGVGYDEPAVWQVLREDALEIDYVYAATPADGIEEPRSLAGAQATPVAVRLPFVPRQVFCAAQQVPKHLSDTPAEP